MLQRERNRLPDKEKATPSLLTTRKERRTSHHPQAATKSTEKAHKARSHTEKKKNALGRDRVQSGGKEKRVYLSQREEERNKKSFTL